VISRLEGLALLHVGSCQIHLISRDMFVLLIRTYGRSTSHCQADMSLVGRRHHVRAFTHRQTAASTWSGKIWTGRQIFEMCLPFWADLLYSASGCSYTFLRIAVCLSVCLSVGCHMRALC